MSKDGQQRWQLAAPRDIPRQTDNRATTPSTATALATHAFRTTTRRPLPAPG